LIVAIADAGEIYGFTLREDIPSFLLPLKAKSEQVMVNLQEILQGRSDRAGDAIQIDYHQYVPLPALLLTEQDWVEKLLVQVN
jgi:Protein of unknown function (DUF4058)